jgi:hypothetical protein
MNTMARFAVLLVLACESGPLKAVDPVWGKQPCAHCAMLVSERASAAQAVLDNGERKFFDDVGCMVAWEAREQPKVKARWVRGPEAEGWVEPSTAKFSSGNPTPMDFGFVAAVDGVTWDEVVHAVQTKARRVP